MKKIQFGQKSEANEYRRRLGDYLSASDDKRTKTVTLKSSTPDSIVDRLESESFASVEEDTDSAGMAELTPKERDQLQKNTSFNWSDNGFGAMRAKAELQSKGATEWTDFYQPGEGKSGALKNLRQSKQRGASTGASIGVGGQRTDEEEVSGRQRRRRQVERGQSKDVDRAKRPAFGGDDEAIGFLREEQIFDDDVFDINLRSQDGPTGRDYEALEEAHESRSKTAQRVDERRSAQVTRDPLKWSEAKGRYDFPGIDTVDPEQIHAQRSKRAREKDEDEFAPIADNRQQWATAPDRYDWRGVDTPQSYGPTMDTPIPSIERNTNAPEPLTTGLSQQDISLAPEEAFEGVGSVSMSTEGPMSGFASGVEADMAFIKSESERASGELSGGGGSDELEDAYGGFSDDRSREGSLTDFGMETDGTRYRESREAVEQATSFGVDDRDTVGRGRESGGMDSSEGDLAMFDPADEAVADMEENAGGFF